jgi:transposase
MAEYIDGEVLFHIEKHEDKQKCAACGSRNVIKQGRIDRKIQTLPIGRKRVWLWLHLHRLQCRECGALLQEPLLISSSKKRWTRVLGRYAIDLLKHMTIKSVADHLGMSWDTVKDIHKQALTQKFTRRKISRLRYLGIDEISVEHGYKFLTIVVDLETGKIVWVGDGRDQAAVVPFFRKLKQARARIEAIAMDMWPAFRNAATMYYPEAVIVYDRYHLVANYNTMLDTLRRQEYRQAREEEKTIYKGTRYLLLSSPIRVTTETAKERLNRLLELNQNLNTAYVLGEDFRLFWEQHSYEEAESFLDLWIDNALSSGIKLLEKFAKTVKEHRHGILNYYKYWISTARVEGINNKIKCLIRQAYGFRDKEYFKLRLYFLHKATYALTG